MFLIMKFILQFYNAIIHHPNIISRLRNISYNKKLHILLSIMDFRIFNHLIQL